MSIVFSDFVLDKSFGKLRMVSMAEPFVPAGPVALHHFHPSSLTRWFSVEFE